MKHIGPTPSYNYISFPRQLSNLGVVSRYDLGRVVTTSLPLGPFDHLPPKGSLKTIGRVRRNYTRRAAVSTGSWGCERWRYRVAPCHVRRALSITREERVSRKLVAHSRVHREKLEIFHTWLARDTSRRKIADCQFLLWFYGIKIIFEYYWVGNYVIADFS